MMMMPEYVFSGKGNYGGESPTPKEFEVAYAAAPKCHHPNIYLPDDEPRQDASPIAARVITAEGAAKDGLIKTVESHYLNLNN